MCQVKVTCCCRGGGGGAGLLVLLVLAAAVVAGAPFILAALADLAWRLLIALGITVGALLAGAIVWGVVRVVLAARATRPQPVIRAAVLGVRPRVIDPPRPQVTPVQVYATPREELHRR